MTQSFSFLTRQKCFWHSYVADWTPAPDDDLYYKSLTYFLLSSMIFDTKCLGLGNFCCRVEFSSKWLKCLTHGPPPVMPEQLTKSRAGGGDLFWRDWQAHQLACCCACPDTTEAENSKLRECAVRYFLVNKKLGFVPCTLEKLCQINCQNQAGENTVKHIMIYYTV